MEILYRILAPDETKLYRSIRLESLQTFPNSYGSNYKDQKAKEKLGFENIIAQELSDQFIMGAFSESSLLGICGFYRNPDQREQHKGAIIQMYVRPTYQGQQIGAALLETTMQKGFELKEIERINLGVYSHNKAAIHLYQKAGFKTYGIEKNCLKLKGRYVDLILMSIER